MNNSLNSPVRRKMPTETLLYENSHGVRMIRYDYSKRCKVKVANNVYNFMTYRFAKVDNIYTSPYLSWANLDCCNGWIYDETYLETAIQEGKKLYAGFTLFISDFGTMDDAHIEVARILSLLPDGCTGGIEKTRNPRFVNYYICRKGSLADFYNIDEVLAYYEKLGVHINDKIEEYIRKKACIEIAQLGANDTDFDYTQVYSTEELIVAGLLLGYPIESTASLIHGY